MTSEQEALLKKARQSVEAARVLMAEGFLAFAVSRAYYAMFYVASAMLLGEGLTYSKHAGVIGGFGQVFAKTARVPPEFHRYLISAQNDRIRADYEAMETAFSDEEVKTWLKRAEAFIALGEQMLSEPPPADQDDTA